MNKLEVLHFPDKRLRKIAKSVEKVDQEIKDIIDQMFFTMYEEKGIGLAATQVNIHKRIIVIDVSENKNEKVCLINPKILLLSEDTDSMEEGCLSVPGFYENVTRPKDIKVSTLNYDGKEIMLETDGLLSTCIQHEIDHLNGKLFVDHISTLKRDRIKKKITKLKKEGTLFSRKDIPNYKSVI
ncbi:MAG: peptide deformylase [Gammaproteobacteria bacterium]|jgi:peptide deformylase|nr:peptide deformylase [Gammaproteobacteria bacterium]MBT7603736.1 peptide deformylase [Gammaproteobacteria bacterium]